MPQTIRVPLRAGEEAFSAARKHFFHASSPRPVAATSTAASSSLRRAIRRRLRMDNSATQKAAEIFLAARAAGQAVRPPWVDEPKKVAGCRNARAANSERKPLRIGGESVPMRVLV